MCRSLEHIAICLTHFWYICCFQIAHASFLIIKEYNLIVCSLSSVHFAVQEILIILKHSPRSDPAAEMQHVGPQHSDFLKTFYAKVTHICTHKHT